MKLERYEPRGRGPLALEPSAFGGLFPIMPAPSIERRGDVAIVSVRGPLVHHAELFCDSYDAVKARVTEALDARPKAVVLSIDSPGGLVSGLFDTALEIRAACESAGVPLHSYIDGMAASAAYALACVGKSVTIPAAGIAGSIGVLDAIVDATAQAAAAGLVVELVASGARKLDQNPGVQITDGARAAVRGRVEELALVFFEHVAKHRAMSVEHVRGLEAGLFTGASAVRAGLADHVASLDDLVAVLAAGSAAPRAQEGTTMTEEEKARAALKAIVDDEKSDEKAKARAKAALAAMDEEEPDGDEPKGKSEHSEPDGDEKAQAAARAAAAVAPLARTSASLEARLAALEAEREVERKDALFAARPDVGAETRRALASLPSAQVKAILDSMPKREPKPAATALIPVTQGQTQVSGASAPAAVSDVDAMDLAMGRASVSSTGVVRSADGRSITLGADVVVSPKKGA